MMTQNEMILSHLKTGAFIEPLEALKKYGVMRLASRIGDLREAGHDILARRVEVRKRGNQTAWVCRYQLIPKGKKK